LPLPLRAWRREKAKGAETASLKSFAMPGWRRGASLIDHHPLEFGMIGLSWISPGSAKALSGFH
jgi:hypothetical protein